MQELDTKHGPWLQPPVPVLGPVIVAVTARKGGVGKTTLSYELAAAWGAVLVDFDWDDGGATIMWGARPSEAVMAALDGGPPPRIRSAPGRPDLVPCHPDLAGSGWHPERIADALERWSAAWGRPIVVDSHPGIGELAFGAMQAAHLVGVPAVLRERELDALAGMLRAHPQDRIVILPNMAPAVPGGRQLRRLEELAAGRPVAPPVSAYPWLGRRARRSALVLTPAAQRTEAAVRELTAMATSVRAALPNAA
jgi:chromosome partitioning protein